MKKWMRKENFISLAIMLIVIVGLLAISQISPRKFYPYEGDENLQVVFMGDSNIAYAFDSDSLPDMLAGAGGYTVFNVAVGGSAAARINTVGNPERGEDLFGFHHLTKIAITQDYQSVVALETEANGEMIGRIACITDIDWSKMDYIVISYGLNDYTLGIPAFGEDALDETTYSGALRAGIQRLQEISDATIILSSITYTAHSDEAGSAYDGYEKDFGGGTIDAYRDAAALVASEFENVIFMDALTEMGIDFTNYETYLLDSMHFNRAGREKYLECLMTVLEKEQE